VHEEKNKPQRTQKKLVREKIEIISTKQIKDTGCKMQDTGYIDSAMHHGI
jgi:hypothetical protein